MDDEDRIIVDPQIPDDAVPERLDEAVPFCAALSSLDSDGNVCNAGDWRGAPLSPVSSVVFIDEPVALSPHVLYDAPKAPRKCWKSSRWRFVRRAV